MVILFSWESPALISNTCRAGFEGEDLGRSFKVCPGSGGGALRVISITVHWPSIHTMSSGKCMSFIQKTSLTSLSKMKSIPVPGSMWGRSDSP